MGNIQQPDKLLVGKIKYGTSTVSAYNVGGTYDGAPLSYVCTFEVSSFSAGFPAYQNNPNLYNAYDIKVGWQFLLPNGRWYDITNIISVNNDNEIILEITDTDLHVLVADPSNDPPQNGPTENNYGIFYPLVNGIPKLANLSNFTTAFPIDGYWIDDIEAATTNRILDFLSNETLFNKTGSFWSTTNDLQITGSLKILGDLEVQGTTTFIKDDPYLNALIVSGAMSVMNTGRRSGSIYIENLGTLSDRSQNSIIDLGGF
jgi:hypothetical protein